MKKALMIANTYYQLIMAIQIKLTILNNQYVDFVFTDRTPGAQDVVDRLNNLNVFNSANYVHVKDIDLRYEKSRYGKVILENIFDSKRNDYLIRYNLKDNDYTELWFYNYELELYGIIDRHFGEGCVLNRFEEGIFSYNDSKPEKKIRFMNMIRKIQKRITLDDYKCFYCTNPEFLDATLFAEKNLVRIPNLCRDDKNLINILNAVFDYKDCEDVQKHKILYFTTSLDVDGYPIHEEEILEKVILKFGKENVCLKVHPRDKRDVYKKMGVTIAENSNVPWEIIQMNFDPVNKKFTLTLDEQRKQVKIETDMLDESQLPLDSSSIIN